MMYSDKEKMAKNDIAEKVMMAGKKKITDANYKQEMAMKDLKAKQLKMTKEARAKVGSY